MKSEGASTSRETFVDPSGFKFGENKALADTKEEKSQAVLGFCSGPLESQSSWVSKWPYSLPKGEAPSSAAPTQQRQLLHHPSINLNQLNLLDLQNIPAAYLWPEVVAELAAGVGTRVEVGKLLNQDFIATHLHQQDPKSIALPENYPQEMVKLFRPSFCRKALELQSAKKQTKIKSEKVTKSEERRSKTIKWEISFLETIT